MRLISGVDMPSNMVTARLMTRRYVDALLRHEEREIEIGGLWAITGFAQQAVVVEKTSTSRTTYTLARRIGLFVNSVTSFSAAPLVAIFWMGLAIFAIAMVVMTAVLVQWMFLAEPVSGWTSLILSVWLIGSMIISFIGVVGIYLAKILSEVKQRPYTIVRSIHGREP
jgi:putative glycosyltransferase